MSFLEALLDSNNKKERKKKQACATAIAITAILLVIAIIAFAVCQVVAATSNNDVDEEKDTGKQKIDLGETISKTISEEQIYAGNLLTLNDNSHFKGEPELINIYENRKGAFLSIRQTNRSKFEATANTVENLCKMVTACNEAISDDNLLVSNAYNTSEISSQKGIYSSGEAIALSYFNTESKDGESPINEDEKYKWIYTNCYKYGFVPVASNSNVFRYIGNTTEAQAHALAAKNMGSLDKYLNELKKATVDNPMAVNADGTIIAYTCPINDVKVPKNHSYKISGNNLNGVIVTVTLTKSTSNNIE